MHVIKYAFLANRVNFSCRSKMVLFEKATRHEWALLDRAFSHYWMMDEYLHAAVAR